MRQEPILHLHGGMSSNHSLLHQSTCCYRHCSREGNLFQKRKGTIHGNMGVDGHTRSFGRPFHLWLRGLSSKLPLDLLDTGYDQRGSICAVSLSRPRDSLHPERCPPRALKFQGRVHETSSHRSHAIEVLQFHSSSALLLQALCLDTYSSIQYGLRLCKCDGYG